MNKDLRHLTGFCLLALGGGLSCWGQVAESQQQAVIRGDRGAGRCVVEVEVDGTAEVYVKDQIASLRTLAGQPARWRRFECTQPMPRNPDGFDMRSDHGRGQMRLIHDPSRGGVAVVRIEDQKGGTDTYAFTLVWRVGDGGFGDGDRRGDRNWDRNRGGGYDRDRVVQRCTDAVADRLQRDGYRDVRILGANAEDRPGRRDRVLGRVSAQERWGQEDFSFACGVTFEDGSVRSVDVVPR